MASTKKGDTNKGDTLVNNKETIKKITDTSKRKNPCSPDDLLATKMQQGRQTKPRKLSYSADNLDQGGVDENKVEKILNKTPGVTFNLPELVCAVLQDDNFIEKLTPKITEALWSKIEAKYDKMFTDYIKPMQEKIDKQDELLNAQNDIINKQVQIVNDLEHKLADQMQINDKLEESNTQLHHQITDLDNRLDEQEQYSRRTSLRFHNIPCPDPKNIRKMDTDKIILEICNKTLGVPITLNELGRTHPIGKVKNGKVQVIARFISYRHRNSVFSVKKNLKGNENNIFITENLTHRRQQIMNELNYLRFKKKIASCWSYDGRLFAIGKNTNRINTIWSFDDIHVLLNDAEIDGYNENS